MKWCGLPLPSRSVIPLLSPNAGLSPGSVAPPQPPSVNFGDVAPPAAYFDPMAVNPHLVDQTVRFPSTREGS